MTVSALFLLIAAVICLGFAGKWIFRLTRIPDPLLLIAAGMGIRSLLGVSFDIVHAVAPFFGAFALIVILFEGGLHLDFDHMLRGWRRALLLTLLSFALSLVLILLIGTAFGRAPLHAALLASAVACTSAAIVIPIIREVRVAPQSRTVLELESSLSDTLAVLCTVLLLNLFTQGARATDEVGALLFTSFTGALVVGAGLGLAWTWVLKRMAGQPLCYLMTFAGMLVVYAISEGIHSSGVLAVFIFALALSNGPRIIFAVWPKSNARITGNEIGGAGIHTFHAELTFLVRTFFFVFLGMLFDVQRITLVLAAEALLIYVGAVVARLLAVWLVTLRSAPESPRARRALFLFMPRGLASAVLATFPAARGMLGTEDFVAITVLVILLSNVMLTFGIRWVESPARGTEAVS